MRTMIAIGLLLATAGCGLAQATLPDRGRVGIYGESWLVANGVGASFRSGLRDHRCYELSASYVGNGGFESVTAFGVHASQLWDVTRRKTGRFLLGMGVSYARIRDLSDAPLFFLHAKVALDIPLGDKLDLRLGSYPVQLVAGPPFVMPFPNLHLGLSFRL